MNLQNTNSFHIHLSKLLSSCSSDRKHSEGNCGALSRNRVSHCRHSLTRERCLFYCPYTLVCNSQLSLWILLGAFSKLRKEAISFVMSLTVCPSV